MFLRWNLKFFFSTANKQQKRFINNKCGFFLRSHFVFFFAYQANWAHSNWLSHDDARFWRMRSCEIYDFEYVPCLLCIIFCSIYKSRFDFLCSILKFSWQYFLTTKRSKCLFSGPITIKCVIDIVLLKF